MTSLSDNTTQNFKPLKLETLESFNDELYNRGEDTPPDLDRFKVLYEPKKLVGDDPDIFEFLYDYKKEISGEKNDFIATFARVNVQKTDPDSRKEEEGDTGEIASSEGPKDIKASKQTKTKPVTSDPGFDKGIEQGLEQGQTQGYDNGFKEGFEKGLAQGEEQGLEKEEKRGFDLGFAKGEKEATQHVEETAGKLLDMLKNALEKSDQVYEQLVDTCEAKILTLLSTIAEKIIFEQIRINEDVVRHTVLDALKHLAAPEEVILSVSVEDYETIEMIKEDFFEAMDSLKNISVISDASIHRGGCRIKTATGTISADPKAKLDAIIDSMATVKNR